ncbi:MAG: 23S rRNA (adenine(2030)-N(6))-methyltransferase RlmJ [Promethearchaeia archaeon]
MGYKHYGNIGDIWKHLPLCSFLTNEEPRFYIETNSARPIYRLNHNPAREYGVYTFFRRVENSTLLSNTNYVKLIQNLPDNQNGLNTYLGSPGLAMKILSSVSEKFIFFDIENKPLEAIQKFSENLNLKTIIETHCKDSIIGSYELLEKLTKQDFIHFDPYHAFEKGKDYLSYFDVFLEATKRDIKCMLWYAYFTLKEKREITEKLQILLNKHNIDIKKKKIKDIEIYLEIIQEENILVNPGVLGCGILVSNLSNNSLQHFDDLSDELVSLYKATTLFDTYQGDLRKDVIF